MRIPKIPFLRRFVKDERGQTAVLITLMMVTMTAMSAMGIEAGHIYYAYRLLQASTNAAALAGGQAMPNITQATTNATNYSAESGKLNANSMLNVISLTPNFYCSTKTIALNIACQAPPSGEGSCTSPATTCNALTLTQKASVPLWFGGLLGMRSMTMSASASAAMKGGNDTPFNIAVIIDTTASMATDQESNCTTGAASESQIKCAIYGLQQFLLDMDPCPLNTTCSSSPTYVDDVALFTFPALAAGTSNIQKDTTCPTSDPTTVPYAFPDVTSDPATSQNLILPTSTPTSNAGTYEIVAFSNSYKTSDGSTTLAPSPNPLAVAAGTDAPSCQGLQAPGGEHTYYAQAIYAAQAALYTMSGGSTPNGSQNIMIILSDGDASACNQYANTSAGGCQGSNDIVALNCPTPGGTGCSKSASAPTNPPLNGTGTATTNPNWTYSGSTGGYQSPIYPSALGECGQAVEAAQKATAAGTTVFTVAMGSETSGSCSSDATYTVSDSYTGATYGMVAWSSGKQACTAIEAMASAPKYAVKGSPTFYSDASKGCTAPPGTAAYTTIGEIFNAIAGSLTNARLIPPNS